MTRALSPCKAAILLVAGAVPEEAAAALDRLHDQLPRPRATFAWDGGDDALPGLVRHWRAMLAGADQADRLPDEPPNPWRGEGGKFILFVAVIDGGFAWLAVVGVANSVLSLFFYLRVIAPMVFAEPSGEVQGLVMAASAAALVAVVPFLGALWGALPRIVLP